MAPPVGASVAKLPAIGAETSVQAVQSVGALVIMPQSFGEVMMFADKMAESRFVPGHLRSRPSDCLAVCLQALRWGMDPFSVAQKTYFTKEGSPPAYEAQLVNAVVYARAPLVGRLKIEWTGQWPNRVCTVTGHIVGDDNPKIRVVPAVNIKVRNSPLWTTDPDQQLAYYTTRAWARLYVPDVLMGVYTPDDEDTRAEVARDITPEPRPQPATRLDGLEQTIEAEAEPAEEAPAPEPAVIIPMHWPLANDERKVWIAAASRAISEVEQLTTEADVLAWQDANADGLRAMMQHQNEVYQRLGAKLTDHDARLTGTLV